MASKSEVLDAVRRALRSEPRIDPRTHPITVDFADGTLTMEGEVDGVAAKKLALERAAAVSEVTGVIDRLRIAPAQRAGDGEIRDQMGDALLQEPAFADCAVERVAKGNVESLRRPDEARGRLTFEVADGVITINGRVPGHAMKRLAGVLAWWIPGSRDVINGLVVDPEEADSDGAVTDAVRLALEKDPFVDASQVRVFTLDCVVRLDGVVPSEAERDMAESDAWYVFGVDRVINRIEVSP
jgi:osmotically-inducible protein OsmY